MQELDKQPDRVALVNLVTGDSRFVQYNPEQLESNFGVTYADLQVPGLSHKRRHFINSENAGFNFDLQYRAIGTNQDQVTAIQTDKKWFQSLTKPHRAANFLIGRGGAPRVLFIWPEYISLVCTIESLKIVDTQFRSTGMPVAFTMSVAMKEVGDVFVSMEDVLNSGLQRTFEGNLT